MRHEIPLTDEQIEAHFDEQSLIGCAIDDVSFTRSTLADFVESNRGYAEPGRLTETVLGGYPALMIERAQAAKGQPRKDVVLIDYGTVRAFVAA